MSSETNLNNHADCYFYVPVVPQTGAGPPEKIRAIKNVTSAIEIRFDPFASAASWQAGAGPPANILLIRNVTSAIVINPELSASPGTWQQRSQAFPTPLLFASSWPGLKTPGQLSTSAQSPSASMSFSNNPGAVISSKPDYATK